MVNQPSMAIFNSHASLPEGRVYVHILWLTHEAKRGLAAAAEQLQLLFGTRFKFRQKT